jgi:hypothetical protein
MNVRIDAFSDDDPLNIYQNILKSKIKYTKILISDNKIKFQVSEIFN